MKPRISPFALAALGLLLACPLAAQIPHYTITDLGPFPTDSHNPVFTAPTRNGYVAGYYQVQTIFPPDGWPVTGEDFTVYMVIYKNGILQSTTSLGLPASSVTAINDNGATIGNAANYEYSTFAFTPNGYGAEAVALALNENNQAVGYFYDYKYTGSWNAALWGFTTSGLLPLPGDTQTTANGLSDNGIVVGVSGSGFNQYPPPPPPLVQHAFLWKSSPANNGNGTTSALPPLNAGENSAANYVNNLGDAIGVSGNANVLWPAKGGIVVLPAKGAGINDRGQVLTSNGLWTPGGGIQAIGPKVINGTGWGLLRPSKLYLDGSFSGSATYQGRTYAVAAYDKAPISLQGLGCTEKTPSEI